ncbi:hypothetical protein CPB84DRAFT_1843500 [Gymnopilus junonius]|uniref:Uncharacterized protein n=1 Tax=Gymnopilus junonius TaxID=109634 RepID=A0A9P5NW11_GYMJU|nr:hypothetical protein CPB84DRAFT_1843500 [Gymnopilus junonius]
MTTLPAHVSSSTTVSYKPDASDFEPDDEWKRQLLERIDKNMESMIQDARDSQAAQLRKAPVSHEERMRLEAEYKQAMSDIKKFATEQYKEELERERGQRRWAAGAPIHPDLNRLLQEEQQNIMNSIKQSADNSAARNAGESPTKERQPGGRTAPVNEAPHVEVPAQPPPPPPPPPQHQEDHDKASLPPPSRSARRPSDAKSTLSRDQDVHHSTSTRRRHGSTHVPTHERPSLPDTWIASDVVEEPEELLRSQSSRSKQPVDKPPATPDRWEGSLGRSSGSIRSVASDRSIGRSPPKPEVWKPTITPAEDSDAPKLYNLGRRGSTASMRSTGSGNSLRPSITETIPEKEDDVLVEEPLDTSERDNERIQDQEKRQSTEKMREKEKRPTRRRESRPSPVDAAALRHDDSLGPSSLRFAGSPSATMQYATSHLKPPSSNASSINREDRHHITDRPSKPPQPYLDTRDQHLPPREPPYLHRDSPYSSRDTPVSARSSAPARSTYANDDREYLAPHGPGNRPLGPKSPFVGDHDYPSGPPSSVSHKSSFNYEDRRPHRDRDWERERDRDAHWEDDRDLRDRDYRERERERDMYPEGRHPGHYGYSGRSSAGYPTPPSSASRHGSLDYLPMNELYDDRDHPRYYRSAHDEWDYPPRGPPESGRSIPARRPSYRREREDPDRRIPADADNYPHYPPLSGSIPIPPRSVHDPEEPAWKGWGRDLHRQDSYVRSPPSTDHNPRRRPTHPPMVYHGDPRDNSPYGSPEVYRPRRRSDEDDDDEYDDGMESDREDGGAMPSGSGSEEDDIEEEEEEEEASKREVEARRLEAEKKAADEQIRLKELELKRLKAEEARLEAETLRREEEMRKKQEEVRKMEEEAKQKEEEFQKRELEALKMDEERKRKEEEVRKKVEDAKKKEKEVRKREQEAKRKADDAQKLEEEARRKEEEARKREEKLKEDAERTRRLQEEAKRITEEARVAQENLKRIEEETRKKEEEIRRREVALFAREEEVKRREAEAKKKEEETRRKEQQAKKLEEEDKRRAEEARQKVENAKLETAKQEEAKVRADRIRLEQENKRQQQEAERRRHEDELLGIDPRIVEEQQRLWNQVKREEEFRKRAEDIKRHREERKRNDSLGPESAWSIPTQPSPGTSPGMSRSPQFNGTSASDRNSGNSSWSSPGSAWTSTTKPTSAAPSTPRPPTAVPPAGKPRNGSVSSGTYPAPGTSPHAAGISEAEHMRRQAEFTNQQQEKFRREQERIEAERQMRAAGKPLSREDVQRAFEHHDRLWTRLPTIDELTWNDFPWPMLKAPSNPDDISSALISAYFQSPLWPDKEKSKTPKDRIKEHVRRWHPDRFETKVLPRVVDSEKEKVKSGAGNVARYLNDLLRKENENSSSVNIFGD